MRNKKGYNDYDTILDNNIKRNKYLSRTMNIV